MKLETFFEKFEQFAEAPDAVAKMRELVLELAVQGKLVAQSSDDEPAFKQLERIAAKKAQCGRVARMRANIPGRGASTETGKHIPNGWERTSLAELVTVLNGRAYSKSELLVAGTPVLRVGNLFTSKHWYYSNLELEADKYCDKGDLLFAWSASFGPFIWPGPKVIYHYHIWKLELHNEADLSKDFLRLFLQNKTQEIKRSGHGVSMLHMTKENMEKLEVLIPPLAEQKRIVAKVDELMALCDRLEAQQQERETRHAALARASLARFAAAPTPANLPFLFHPSYAIPPADLRKSILTLAVQGKLVPQDPNDEPAESQFGRNEELYTLAPFEIPRQWAWSQLNQIADINGGFAFKSTAYTKEGMRVVRISDFDEFGFKEHKVVRHPFSPDLQKFTLAEQNILMAMTGGTVGKSYFVRALQEPMVVNQRVATIKVSANAYPSYLDLVIRSEMTQEVIQNAKNSTNDNISMGDIKGFTIPLPPLAEQRRIVAKVDQLMALVDELEAQLVTSRAAAANLLDALVAELTGTVRRPPSVAPASAQWCSATGQSPGTAGFQPAVMGGDAIVPRLPVGNRRSQALAEHHWASAGMDGRLQPAEPPTVPAEPSPGAAEAAPPSRLKPALPETILTLLRERGSLSNSEAQAATGLDPATIREHLRTLVAAGQARTEGQRRGMRYHFVAKASHAE